jgi:hypothetical protein
MYKRFGLVAVGAAALVGLVACGDSDEGDAAGSDCEIIGGSAAGGGVDAVNVTLKEWSITAETSSAAAGAVTFAVRNDGEEPHELVILRATPADLTVVDGQVDEEALGEEAFVGEVESFESGGTCEGTFELTAGEYVLFCNILEEEDDGEVESHFDHGMITTFTVT